MFQHVRCSERYCKVAEDSDDNSAFYPQLTSSEVLKKGEDDFVPLFRVYQHPNLPQINILSLQFTGPKALWANKCK